MWQLVVRTDQVKAFQIVEKIEPIALTSSLFLKNENQGQWEVCALFDSLHLAELSTQGFPEECEWQILPLEDRDWVKENRESFPPLEIGSFYIYGSHLKENLLPNKICLQLDASTAFGSGEHATTKLCLQAIEELSTDHTFSHPLDIGCGTGILALAMASLLKKPVDAVDNDPEAIEKTRYNAEVNGLSSLIRAWVSEGWKNVPNKKYDLVVANILAGLLCELAPSMARGMQSQGHLILSGLLDTQADQVIITYESHNFALIHQLQMNEWVALIMRKIL